jgi:uncharacterized protein (DUF433 family)
MIPMFDRITFEPEIMRGQACIRGMRIPVFLIVNLCTANHAGRSMAEHLRPQTPYPIP